MVLAADSTSYPALGVFWSIFIFFLWVIWIWILISIFIDIFRSRDLSGLAKALWILFVLFIPMIGVLVYLIVRGGKMHERAVRQARRQDQEARAYIREAAARRARRTSWPSWPACATRELSRPRSSTARRPRSWPERTEPYRVAPPQGHTAERPRAHGGEPDRPG